MIFFTLKIIVFKNRNIFLNFFAVSCLPGTHSHWGQLFDASLILLYFFRHQVLVVIIVCYLSFLIVFSSSPINNKFHWPSSVALLYYICSLSLYHLIANCVKLWMSGVGTLCAYAHYRAFLLFLKFHLYMFYFSLCLFRFSFYQNCNTNF